MNNIKQQLKSLTSLYAVSGYEKDISEYLASILKSYGDVRIDDMNNVICTFGEGKHYLLDAHIDEIGFIVKSITDCGFLKLEKCGGIDNRMLLGSELTVLGKQSITGIISTLPPHLQKEKDNKAPEINEISVDVGLTQDEAKEIVSVGDRAVFKHNFIELLGNQICSSALDDRVGVCAILNALDELKNINAKITILFSSQEEIGTRGAKSGVYDIDCDEAIVVDVSFGYSPLCNRSECGEIGNGAMIGISPILDRRMSDSMTKIAKSKNIPHQPEVMGGGHTGTNADVITISQRGIRTSLLSIPLKYMHSPIEIIDTGDIQAVTDLIVEYIREDVGVNNA